MHAGVVQKKLLKSCSPRYEKDTSGMPIIDVRKLCSAENGCVVPIIGFRVDVCQKRPLPLPS